MKEQETALEFQKNSQLKEMFRRLARNRGAMAGIVILSILLLMALSADLLFDYETMVEANNISQRLIPPCWEHPFGTDDMGRDMLVRILYGARYSLAIGAVAVLIALVPALYRKALISAASERAVILDTTQRCGDYFRALFAAQAREVFYQACLDGKGKLLNLYRISEGDVSSVTLNIRTIAENAIRANAVQVVLAHNHPSGIALPSEDDIATTEQAQKALGTIGVRLADHIIVADGDFVSMADSGYLEGY